MVIRIDLEGAVKSFWRQVLMRLHLADAVLSLWAYVMQEEFLNGVFEEHRGRSYEEVVTFPRLVELIADALIQYEGSGRQSFVTARENDATEGCVEAYYGKLRRIPVELSIGLLEAATLRLRAIQPATAPLIDVPESLQDFQMLLVDGKTLKKCAKRLRPARGQAGALYGGKLLVAYEPATGLAVSFAAAEDGETNDAKLMPELIPQTRQATAGNTRLWVLDRQFCDLTQPALLSQDGDHYLIRYHPKNTFTVDTERSPVVSVDAEGRTVTDTWGWLGAAKSKRRRYLRRVCLQRPGEEEILVMTDLLDETIYPGVDLVAAYGHRWGIESIFQQVTEVFELRSLIGSTARATIFQGSFCLLLSNFLQVMRQHIAASQQDPIPAASLSIEMIFRDVTRELIALNELVKPAAVAALIPSRRSASALDAHLHTLLSDPIRALWKKTTNRKRRRNANAEKQSGAHTSIARLIAATNH